MPVNNGGATFTGSHIAYVDYDKASFKAAVMDRSAIAPTVEGAGELFHTYVFALLPCSTKIRF